MDTDKVEEAETASAYDQPSKMSDQENDEIMNEKKQVEEAETASAYDQPSKMSDQDNDEEMNEKKQTVEFQLVTNYKNIKKIQLILSTKRNKLETIDMTFESCVQEISEEYEYTIATVSEDIPLKQEAKIEFYIKIMRIGNIGNTVQTKRQELTVDNRSRRKCISFKLLQHNQEQNLIGRLILIDKDFDREADLSDATLTLYLEYVGKMEGRLKHTCMRIKYIQRWIGWRLKNRLSKSRVLFIVFAVQKMLPSPNEEDMLNHEDAQILLETLRKERIEGWKLMPDFSLWLLESIGGTWLHAFYYFSQYFDFENLCIMGDKLTSNFDVNTESWLDFDRLLSPVLGARHVKHEEHHILLEHVLNKITNARVLINFINLCKCYEKLNSQEARESVTRACRTIMASNGWYEPDKVAQLLSCPQYANSAEFSEVLVECARKFVFDSDKWDTMYTKDICKLIMFSSIYHNKTDVSQCFDKLCHLLEKENLEYHVLRDFLRLDKVRSFMELDNIKREMFFKLILTVQYAPTESQMIYFYPLATIYKQCTFLNSEIINECDEELFGIDIDIKLLIACVERKESHFSDDTRRLALQHIIQIVHRKEDSTPKEIVKFVEIFQHMERNGVDDVYKRLIGIETLATLGKQINAALRSPTCLAKGAERDFEVLFSTNCVWKTVYSISVGEGGYNTAQYLVHTVRIALSHLKTGNCSFRLSSFIKNHNSELTELSGLLGLTQEWNDSKDAAFSMVSNGRTKANRLQNALKFMKRLNREQIVNVPEMHQIQNEMKQILQLVHDDSESFINETRSDTFWGSFVELDSAAASTFALTDSILFYNICCKIFRSVKDSFTLKSFATKLELGCLPSYEKWSRDIFECTGTILVSDAAWLLCGVDNDDILRKELQFWRRQETVKQSQLELHLRLSRTFMRYQQMKSKYRGFYSILKIVGSRDDMYDAVETLAALDGHSPDMNLDKLMTTMALIDQLRLRKCDWDVLHQLEHCRQLVNFLKPIISTNEDLRNLADAVEELEARSLHIGIVSDLIDVKRFIHSILKVEGSNTAKEIANVVQKYRDADDKLAGKIEACTNASNAMIYIHASRTERMSKIIKCVLKHGVFNLTFLEGSASCVTECEWIDDHDDERRVLDLDELHDLKRRALFAINSRLTPASEDMSLHLDYRNFIEVVKVVTEIRDRLIELKEVGHFNYIFVKPIKISNNEKTSSRDQLDKLLQNLTDECDAWRDILQEARVNYYDLNFFTSKQLWLLDYLFSENIKECLTIEEIFARISLVGHTNIKHTIGFDEVHVLGADSQQQYKSTLQRRLYNIGDMLKNHVTPPDPIEYCSVEHKNHPSEDHVVPGKHFVVDRSGDTNSISVLMQVYLNTYGKDLQLAFWQVLFCSKDTTNEDVSLLLQRCAGAYEHGRQGILFSLVNVEQLTREVQIHVVGEVRRLLDDNTHFMLCIITSGGRSNYNHDNDNYVLSQFDPQYTQRMSGVPDDEFASWLTRKWKSFEIVTSDASGQGKTEYITTKATTGDQDIVKITISGPITRNSLVEKFCEQKLHEKCLLHIDAGMVSDPDILDTLLLELAVVGTVYNGTYIFCLKTPFVCLEIANTTENKLQTSISACRFLKKHNVTWDNFENLIVCQESQSSIQVVCKYLKALDDKTLDESDIKLTDGIRLSTSECRRLLKQEFPNTSSETMSFTKVEMYLNVFAEELKRMSVSSYFTATNVKERLKDIRQNLRTQLVKELDKMAKTFQEPHVNGGIQNTERLDHDVGNSSVSDVSRRTSSFIRWEGSNHTLLVFNSQDAQTVSLLYRSVDDISQSIRELYKTQLYRDKELPMYEQMTEEELQEVLERVCCTRRTKIDTAKFNYVLTPDNLLKMIFIFKRIKARRPTIIEGETGCGKTLLVTYLANICDIPLHTFHVHAGTRIEDILEVINTLKEKAKMEKANTIWVFFDEINTCEHMAVLGEMVVYKSFQGKHLPSNLVFIAACNPYRKKTSRTFGGLDKKYHFHEKPELVYRVQPMPQWMRQFVWNFGGLQENDEEKYIRRMLGVKQFNIWTSEETQGTFTTLVFKSQQFIRNVENTQYCVSLRDVHRCRELALFFTEWLKKKGIAHVNPISKEENEEAHKQDEVDVRAIILTLTHCYYFRLVDHKERKRFLDMIGSVFHLQYSYATATYVESIINLEQLDLLRHMERPKGIALNSALKENVFVILVSILNKIPIFVVGNPGCSKSLSLQLIGSNLKGKDSKSDFLKRLPAVYMITHQGSKSSTPEGINKVFVRAKQLLENAPNVLPVVLLDEVGLAEISPANPLKVLHSLLEPSEGDHRLPVVGLSNWALDAAKMNRAVYLSRPEPNKKDLIDTAIAIRDDMVKMSGSAVADQKISDDHLKMVATAYMHHRQHQQRSNFHGLRDYYALVKCISNTPDTADFSSQLESGILRNFGGLQRNETRKMIESFFTKMQIVRQLETSQGVLDRIRNNLHDALARHLMIIINGDSMLSILEKTLKDRKYIVLFGSQFENDFCEEYSYRVLSDIILYMEKGVTVILRDLDCIYECLYDMLNQNYTCRGSRRYSRIALGPYKSPMCEVHEKFKCIVLIDENDIVTADPPFLNRFEKQMLNFTDLLTPEEDKTLQQLKLWICDLLPLEPSNEDDNVTEIEHDERSDLKADAVIPNATQPIVYQLDGSNGPSVSDRFDPGEIFVGFNNENLASVVFHLSETQHQSETLTLLQRCKEALMLVAYPSAVLRSSKSKLAIAKPHEVREFISTYFSMSTHTGLANFMKTHFNACTQGLADDGLTTVIYTLSSIHIDLEVVMKDICPIKVERLWMFKSEQDFSEQIRNFWLKSDAKLLILQCKPDMDEANMQLAKHLLDKCKSEYTVKSKYVCILIHISRPTSGDPEQLWQNGYLPRCHHVTIDCLVPSKHIVKDLIGVPLSRIIDLYDKSEFQTLVTKEVKWSVACLKYRTEQRDVQNTLKLAGMLMSRDDLIKPQVVKAEEEHEKADFLTENSVNIDNWLVNVACNKSLLFTYRTLDAAVKESIRLHIRSSVGKIIYFLEANSAFCNVQDVSAETFAYWVHCFTSHHVFDICSTSIPEPRGLQSCLVMKRQFNFKFPFSMVFHEKISECKELWREIDRLSKTDTSSDTCLQHDTLSAKLTEIIRNTIPEIEYNGYLDDNVDSFLEDVYQIFASEHHIDVNSAGDITKWFFTQMSRIIPEQRGLTKAASLYITIWTNEDQMVMELQLLLIYKQLCPQPDILETLQSRMLELQSAENLDNVMVGVMVYVVETICRLSLPTKNVLNKCGGLKPWQEHVTSIIQYAKKLRFMDDSTSCLFYFLCLCRDFVNILLPEFHNIENSVVKLAELGNNITDLSEVFEFLKEQIRIFMPQNSNNTKAFRVLQDFMGMYFTTALEANPDLCKCEENKDATFCPMEEMLTCTFANAKPALGAYQFLYLIIKTDLAEYDPTVNGQSNSSFGDMIIRSETIPESFSNLQCVDRFLRKDDLIDNHMSVMCCDIIEKMVFSYVTTKRIQQTTHSGDEIFKTSKIVGAIIHNQAQSSLRLLFAIAFASAFFRAISELGTETLMELFKTNQPVTDSLNEILCNIQVEANEFQRNRSKAVCVYFLKCLRRKLSICDLPHVCTRLECSIPALKSLEWQSNYLKRCLGNSPMNYVEHYKEALVAVQEWPMPEDENHSKLINLMNRVPLQGGRRLALAAAIIDKFFLVKGTRPLQDLEKEESSWLIQNVKRYELSAEYQIFLKFLLHNNSPNMLHLPAAEKQNRLHQFSVFVHLASIVLSVSGEDRSFSECIFLRKDLTGQNLKASGIPIHTLDCENVMSAISTSSMSEIICFSCCHHIIIEGRRDQVLKEMKCPVGQCSSELNLDDNSIHRLIPEHEILEDLSSIDLSVKTISPIAYRTLHLFLHGCFQLGLLMDVAIQEHLTKYLDYNVVLSSSDANISIEHILWEKIETDWNALQKLLNLDSENIALFMHNVLRKCKNDLESKRLRPEFEATLSHKVDCEVKALADGRRDYRKYVQKPTKSRYTGLEQDIEELCDHSETSRAANLPRLFRNKSDSTFSCLKARVVNDFGVLAEDHGFFCLFISMKEQLECVRHIMHLLDWHLFVTDMLNYRIDRKEADKPIDHFLENTRLGGHGGQQIFLEFQKSWNMIRNKWRFLTGKKPNFEEMSNTQKLSTCLPKDHQTTGQIEEIISILLHIQNRFLHKTLCIAVTRKCHNLSFLLKKNVAVLPSFPLIGNFDKIIDFEWQEKYLIFSESNTEYGKGGIINYNFIGLERHLCGVLVVGKGFLTSEHTFIKFSFKKELINTYGSIRELSSRIPQKNLPPATAEAIRRVEPGETRTLREHLDIASSYLNHPGNEGVQGELYLNDYMRTNDLIPEHRFSKTCASIKLCHIVNFYKILEETLAEVTVLALNGEFREKVTSDERCGEQFVYNVKMTAIQELGHILSIIKIFVFRYLRQDKIPEAPNTSLIIVMRQRAAEISLDRDEVDRVAKILLEEVKLCHVVDVIAILQIRVENEKLHVQPSQPRKNQRKPRRRKHVGLFD